MSRLLPLVVVLALLPAGLAACSDEGDGGPGGDGDADADTDASPAVDGGPDGSCSPPGDAGASCVLVPDPCLPGRMEVGSGSFSFQEIGTGHDEVDLIHGPQGGYHVFGSLRVKDVALDPSVSVLFGFRAPDACDDLMLPEAKTPISIGQDAFRNAGDGWRAAYGYLVILDTTAPLDLDGRRFILSAELTDAAGTLYRNEVEVLVRYTGD